MKNWGKHIFHWNLNSKELFSIFQSSGETALNYLQYCFFFTVILCANHPVQQSQATFSPSLHVADLENKSFHRFSASRQQIPFEYILKGNANVSRIEMISTIFQPKKTFSNSSFDPLPLDRLVPTSKPPSLNAKTRVQKSCSELWLDNIIGHIHNSDQYVYYLWGGKMSSKSFTITC